ncbi:MAG: hypothetical protein H6974_07290 [Gammaproteobacteria bacterium]|nr:hypothetical protein [Gammaproteobacteria bacterium]
MFAIVVSSFLLSMHQVVVADDMDAFVEACLSATNIERPMCECTARKAKQELSPKGFDFVVAVLRQDEAVTAKLRAEMTVQETMKAGTFMTRGPMQCAQEG